MLLASVMAAGTFTTTAFAYTGDDVQKNTSVSTAAQEADATESANAGKTDNTDSIEIDPDMQVLPDGYEVSADANGNLIVTVGGKEYNIGSEKSQKPSGRTCMSGSISMLSVLSVFPAFVLSAASVSCAAVLTGVFF